MIEFCPSSVVWGDVATWAASISTFAAVFAAVYSAKKANDVANRPLELERRDRSAKAILLAWHLQKEIELTRSAVREVAKLDGDAILQRAAGDLEGEDWRIVRSRVRNAALPLTRFHVFDLINFQDDAARQLAAAVGPVEIMRSYVEEAERHARVSDRLEALNRAVDIAKKILPQLDAASLVLARTANTPLPSSMLAEDDATQ